MNGLRRLAAPLAVLCLGISFAAYAYAQVAGRVLAVVNRDVITQRDVTERTAPAIAAIKEAALSPEEREAQIRQIYTVSLRALVDEKLLAAEGNRLVAKNEVFGTRIEERQKEFLEAERRRAGGELAFRENIRKKGLTHPEYLKRVQTEILQQAVLFTFVERDLSVSPAEMLDYCRKNPARLRESAKVRYRQIFLRAENPEALARARKTAAYLMELIKKQHDFEKLAREYSDGPRAKDGGLWDFTRRGLRPEPIDDLVFSLAPGKVSEPIETEIGLTIIKVEERKPARTIPFEEAQAEIERDLLARKRRQRYVELMQRLEAENYVEIKLGTGSAASRQAD